MEVLLGIVFGSLFLAVAGIVIWKVGTGRDAHGTGEKIEIMILGIVMFVVFAIATLGFGIAWGSTYITSYNDIQQLRAFQNETMSAYQYAIDRTENVVIDASRTRDGSITDFSYQQQGQSVSERASELRNMVAWHNREYYRLLGKNRIPIIGAMYKDVPEDLKPIKLGSLP